MKTIMLTHTEFSNRFPGTIIYMVCKHKVCICNNKGRSKDFSLFGSRALNDLTRENIVIPHLDLDRKFNCLSYEYSYSYIRLIVWLQQTDLHRYYTKVPSILKAES